MAGLEHGERSETIATSNFIHQNVTLFGRTVSVGLDIGVARQTLVEAGIQKGISVEKAQQFAEKTIFLLTGPINDDHGITSSKDALAYARYYPEQDIAVCGLHIAGEADNFAKTNILDVAMQESSNELLEKFILALKIDLQHELDHLSDYMDPERLSRIAKINQRVTALSSRFRTVGAASFVSGALAYIASSFAPSGMQGSLALITGSAALVGAGMIWGVPHMLYANKPHEVNARQAERFDLPSPFTVELVD